MPRTHPDAFCPHCKSGTVQLTVTGWHGYDTRPADCPECGASGFRPHYTPSRRRWRGRLVQTPRGRLHAQLGHVAQARGYLMRHGPSSPGHLARVRASLVALRGE